MPELTSGRRRASSSASSRLPPTPRRIVLLVIGGVLVLALAAVAWVGIRAVLAKKELEASVPLASTLQSQIVAGNSKAASATFARLNDHASSAAAYTSDAVWRAFEGVPGVGANLTAVRELTAVIDDLSQNGLGPLTAIAGRVSLSEFKPVNGAIDVAPLAAVQPQIARVSAAFAVARRQVRAIDTRQTVSAVTDATARLRAAVEKAAEGASAVNRAVQLIPAMLGVDGPRNYLLLFQNPAELRASGGIPGALALIHTEAGRIQLVQQATAASFPYYASPVLPLPVATRGLYGDITGQYMQDVTLTPKFALSASLAQEMWRRKFGVTVDGVLSIDPVTLSYLLKATGPITLPTGDVLSSDNAVKLLLSDVYARYTNPADHDRFFAAAAGSVFAAVSGGALDPRALVKALEQAANEHRILLWSGHPAEQAVLADTTFAGGLPVSDAANKRFGVYLNDATGAKMGYFLAVKTAVGQANCRKDGRASYSVEVTLTNTAPSDA
ncbi:MAG: DUF4012 domain-containing protein, partial [Candidatus Saccharibacteria bacterium]|nr:DUF4012 domain-containing protein [Microbacteriaceae bacterium]